MSCSPSGFLSILGRKAILDIEFSHLFEKYLFYRTERTVAFVPARMLRSEHAFDRRRRRLDTFTQLGSSKICRTTLYPFTRSFDTTTLVLSCTASRNQLKSIARTPSPPMGLAVFCYLGFTCHEHPRFPLVFKEARSSAATHKRTTRTRPSFAHFDSS